MRSKRALERASRETSRTGGIAQLAERQLCKLDVAGSNPAASTNFYASLHGGRGDVRMDEAERCGVSAEPWQSQTLGV